MEYSGSTGWSTVVVQVEYKVEYRMYAEVYGYE